MEPPKEASSSPLPADVDVRPKVRQTTTINSAVHSQKSGSLSQRQFTLETDGQEPHQLLQGFQDSNFSPAFSLLPENTRAQHNFTEYSLFQQSDTEFAPLRPYPDVSTTSERFKFTPQDLTVNESAHGSLSQHPLAQETILSEKNVGSLCASSQYKDQRSLEEKVQTPVRSTKNDADSSLDQKKLASDLFGEAVKDETFFLNKDVSAQYLLALLEVAFDLPSSASSASCCSEASIKSTTSLTEDRKTNKNALGTKRSMVREEPSGKASYFQQQTQQTEKAQNSDHSAGVRNITTGSRSTQPDDSSRALHSELLSESDGPELRNQEPTPYHTTYPGERRSVDAVQHTGPISARVGQIQREHDLWPSGNHTGIDGSYLGFLPQSQSTPGVLKAPSKSSTKAKFVQLSDIESNSGSVNELGPGIPSQPADLQPTVQHADAAHQQHEEARAEVQSLPVLSYMQKVDGWKVNPSSGQPSLFDCLALQGFSGVSPKKKAYDAVSDSLNQILTQQARRLQEPLVSSHSNQDLLRSSFSSPARFTSPRTSEAVESAPSERDNPSSVEPQSESSCSTVVVSVHKDQQTDRHPVYQTDKAQDLINLSHFSDVSPDPDLTFSGSQDSYSGIKNQTSMGASSVVSLEFDNYVPHWTSKLTTPPPVYLHNLGIDQYPSTILTPFAHRGKIREPKMSPTDICTLTGSIAMPTRSTEVSQGNSPNKEDSVLSVNSNTSPPISVDSLGPAVSLFSRARWGSLPSKIPTLECEHEPPSVCQSEEESQSSVLDISQQVSNLDLASSLPVKKETVKVHLNESTDKVGENSFVSSKALMEIRKILTRADSLVLTGLSSTSSPESRLHAEDGASVSVEKKTNKIQDSSFSASINAGAHFSQLLTRSSYNSMLTSDKERKGFDGQERLELNCLPTQAQVLVSTAASHQTPVDSGPPGTSVVLSKSVLRTEPEGCSAAPPNKAPNQSSLIQSPQQLSSPPVSPVDDNVDKETETMTTMPADSTQSVTSSAVQEDTDQDVMSEGSSQSSLALRVAKLLQEGSSATMLSSTPSLTDNEESKAREWIKLKISGQQCGSLDLDEEDRRKIEEIKRELLLKTPLKSRTSTDTESSATSSFRVPSDRGPSSSDETHAVTRPGNVFPSQSQQRLIVKLTEPLTQLQTVPPSDLEARVSEIASREGVTIPSKTPQSPTSITITTCRRLASPSPPPLSSTPELLHQTDQSTAEPKLADSQLQHKEDRSTQTKPRSPLDSSLITSHNVSSPPAVEGLTRQETVGGQSALSSPDSGVQINKAHMNKTNQTSQFPAGTGQVSHVHLTLYPKVTNETPSTSPYVVPQLPRRDFVPLRHSSSIGSSPDEGVGSSSPVEWSDAREPARLQTAGRIDASAMFQTAAPLRTATEMSTMSHRTEALLRIPAAATPEPILLPYKPCGSEQLFYIPQTEADVSSSETTMESSHTGSDDAVAPRFSSEVLGHRDLGLDRGVNIRHTEGIYSKKPKTNSLKMHDAPSRDAAVAEDEIPCTNMASEINQKAQRRDWGTGPILFSSHHQQEQTVRGSPEEPASQQSSSLDLLWKKFCEQRAAEQSSPNSDRETLVLEQLERLSRLISRSRAGSLVDKPEKEGSQPQNREGSERRRRTRKSEVQGIKGSRRDKPPGDPRLHNEETSQSANRQETDSLSSMSTVDTARLIRAFGADKVQKLKSSSSLSKLYGTITKQREEMEQKDRMRSPDGIITLSEATDQSQSVVDSTSSTSIPAAHPSRTLSPKRGVKMVSKGIQAGHLEIVCNGTRRHTRDVGTTFPSPASTRASGQISTSSSSVQRGRGGQRSPSTSQSVIRQRKKKRSPGKPYTAGVSWFISAESPRLEARKENRTEEEADPMSVYRQYNRVDSWREPLRPKQIHPDSNQHNFKHHFLHHHHPDYRTPPVSTGLIPVSLQEALETQRPDFIQHSKLRVQRLALQAEERRQRGLFSREREEVFLRLGGRERMPNPSGGALLKRAVPRKEMIQRSKQIYENLPEVQIKRIEERRKAEYRSYRLNAQLYNKKITNRVLGKKLAWQ